MASSQLELSPRAHPPLAEAQGVPSLTASTTPEYPFHFDSVEFISGHIKDTLHRGNVLCLYDQWDFTFSPLTMGTHILIYTGLLTKVNELSLSLLFTPGEMS